MVSNASSDKFALNKRLMPRNTAAAALLPPPRPAWEGIFFSNRIKIPVRGIFVSRKKTSAAFQARLSGPVGRSVPGHSTTISSVSTVSSVTTSYRAALCMTEVISWYPSGRRAPTSRVRFSLAGASSVTVMFHPPGRQNTLLDCAPPAISGPSPRQFAELRRYTAESAAQCLPLVAQNA